MFILGRSLHLNRESTEQGNKTGHQHLYIIYGALTNTVGTQVPSWLCHFFITVVTWKLLSFKFSSFIWFNCSSDAHLFKISDVSIHIETKRLTHAINFIYVSLKFPVRRQISKPQQ